MAATVEGTLLASAARTTTQTVDPFANPPMTVLASPMGTPILLEVMLDMTNVGAAPSVTMAIEGWDDAAGAFRSILATAAITTVSYNRLVLGPDVVAAANASATGTIPKRWRVTVTANNANSGTYSVSARLVSE